MVLAEVGLYFWGLFKGWIVTIFVAPWKTMDMLWLLVPVWVAWFFAEFFQEKQGTSMGNAITNAVVVLWGSIDCTRQTISLMSEGTVSGIWNIIARFGIIAAIFAYGILIVILGIKGNKIIKYIGRVREVTYAFAMFTPVFYNEIPLTLSHIIATLLFFPLFYFTIELIDRYTPNPKAMVEDLEESGGGGSSSKSSFGSDSFGSSSSSGFGSSGSDSFGSSSGKGKGKSDDLGLGDFKI
ncbi:hypothetical protein KY363_02390 [Candidatus Woesearchaeota archaeon]|nr:hypothetical protein [Candidatus Woesearchaeota archaeon]